ncbi:WWE domain/WD domain, G-beta repeat [Novymonas esmeraldas]|uniref:WWE domain/WD domain, G-beta repeat n=1 Tax=Novymonas esmeraldas TaxID=1808958 RepID=A0AAW0EK00_9TRYP
MGAGGSSQHSRGGAAAATTTSATGGGGHRPSGNAGSAAARGRDGASRASTAAGAVGTMPGSNVSYKAGDTLRLIVRMLKPGEALSQEVGRVVEGHLIAGHGIPPPPSESSKEGTVFGWFVEDLERPGTWELYTAESASRLEDAFLNMRDTCTVVMKKHSYTVNLRTMQQLPAAGGGGGGGGAAANTHAAQQRTREVKRVPVITTTDPNTGEVKTKEAATTLVDPFADDEGDGDGGAPAQSIAEGPGDVIGATAGGGASAVGARGRADGNGHLPHLIRTVVPHTSPIYTMECSPEAEQLCAEARAVVEPAGGALVLSGGHDLQLLEWSLHTSTVVTRYALPGTTPKNSVLTANYSGTARWMVAGLDDCTARLYAIGNPTEVHRLEGHTHKVYGAGVLAGDVKAVTASMDCRVKLWDIETGACVHTVVPHKSHIFALRVHPTDPNFALTAGEDRTVSMHDFRQENSVAAVFTGHDRTIWDLDWNPMDVTFAACGMDCTARIFDPRVSTAATETLRNHSRAVHSIRFTPRGRGLLSCGKDFFVNLVDTANWGVQWQAKAHAATVFRVRYHAGKSLMVTGASDASVNVWSWPQLAQL